MPDGDEVTVPLPFTVTESVWVGVWLFVKLAVTCLSLESDNVHAPEPWHAPLHPANEDDWLAGAAVSVTWVPDANVFEHAPVGQLMPEGAEVTVPLPWPDMTTVSVCVPPLVPTQVPPWQVRVPPQEFPQEPQLPLSCERSTQLAPQAWVVPVQAGSAAQVPA